MLILNRIGRYVRKPRTEKWHLGKSKKIWIKCKCLLIIMQKSWVIDFKNILMKGVNKGDCL